MSRRGRAQAEAPGGGGAGAFDELGAAAAPPGTLGRESEHYRLARVVDKTARALIDVLRVPPTADQGAGSLAAFFVDVNAMSAERDALLASARGFEAEAAQARGRSASRDPECPVRVRRARLRR